MTGLRASLREAVLLVLCAYFGFATIVLVAYGVGVVL